MPRSQQKLVNKFEPLYYPLPSKSTKSSHFSPEELLRAHGIRLHCGLALGDLLYDSMSSDTLSRNFFQRRVPWTSRCGEFDVDFR